MPSSISRMREVLNECAFAVDGDIARKQHVSVLHAAMQARRKQTEVQDQQQLLSKVASDASKMPSGKSAERRSAADPSDSGIWGCRPGKSCEKLAVVEHASGHTAFIARSPFAGPKNHVNFCYNHDARVDKTPSKSGLAPHRAGNPDISDRPRIYTPRARRFRKFKRVNAPSVFILVGDGQWFSGSPLPVRALLTLSQFLP